MTKLTELEKTKADLVFLCMSNEKSFTRLTETMTELNFLENKLIFPPLKRIVFASSCHLLHKDRINKCENEFLL